MLDFIAHASSSAGNLYELRDDGRRLAIECGLPWRQLQRALGHGVTALDGLLLSHAHGDHSRAVRDVMRAGVTAYADRETFVALGLLDHHRACALNGSTLEIGPWRVRSFPLPHDAPGTVGFLIQGPSGEKICYATDMAYLPIRWPADTAILALECNWSPELVRETEPAQVIRVLRNHMSLPRLLDALAANDISGIREIHLLHLSDAHADAEAFREAVQRATGKPTYVAQARLEVA